MIMKGNCEIELNISDVELNNAVSKAVSNAVKTLNIEQKVNTEVTRRIGKTISKSTSDGTFVATVAKNVAKTIEVNSVIALIDIEELKNIVAEKICEKMVRKIIK